jgi:hypothetical protein
MGLLYNETNVRKDVYSYKINGGGEFFVHESGTVTITFENGKFVSASFPFSGQYTRNGWRILAEINNKIEEIEKKLAIEI